MISGKVFYGGANNIMVDKEDNTIRSATVTVVLSVTAIQVFVDVVAIQRRMSSMKVFNIILKTVRNIMVGHIRCLMVQLIVVKHIIRIVSL